VIYNSVPYAAPHKTARISYKTVDKPHELLITINTPFGYCPLLSQGLPQDLFHIAAFSGTEAPAAIYPGNPKHTHVGEVVARTRRTAELWAWKAFAREIKGQVAPNKSEYVPSVAWVILHSM